MDETVGSYLIHVTDSSLQRQVELTGGETKRFLTAHWNIG